MRQKIEFTKRGTDREPNIPLMLLARREVWPEGTDDVAPSVRW